MSRSKRRDHKNSALPSLGGVVNDAPILIQRRQETKREFFQGILPHPTILQAYADLIPDAPERFLRRVEKEGEMRHNIMDRITRNNHVEVMFGVFAALVASLAVIGFGFYCVHTGYPTTGLVTIATNIAAIFTVYHRQARARDDGKKS